MFDKKVTYNRLYEIYTENGCEGMEFYRSRNGKESFMASDIEDLYGGQGLCTYLMEHGIFGDDGMDDAEFDCEYRVMDKDEYTSTILANTGREFEEKYDEYAYVLVVILPV